MTNLEFVSMIDKLHEVKTDKSWKLYSIIGGAALIVITIAIWKNRQKKVGDLSICLSEIAKEKIISSTLRSSNSQLIDAVAGKDLHIKELERVNQDMARKMTEEKEKKISES